MIAQEAVSAEAIRQDVYMRYPVHADSEMSLRSDYQSQVPNQPNDLQLVQYQLQTLHQLPFLLAQKTTGTYTTAKEYLRLLFLQHQTFS
jgi:hypothetical protein